MNKLIDFDSEIRSACYSSDGKYIACASQAIKIFDLNTEQQVGRDFVGHEKLVLYLNYSRDNQLLVSRGTDNTIRIWNVQTQQQQGVYTYKKTCTCVCLSPDNLYIISGCLNNDNMVIYNVANGTENQIIGNKEWVGSVGFSQNSQLLISAGFDNTIRLWYARRGEDFKSKQQIQIIKIRVGNFMKQSPNGRLIGTRSMGVSVIRLRDFCTKKLISQFNVLGREKTYFSLSNQFICGGNEISIDVWDIQDRKLVKQLKSNLGIRSVFVSPDNNRVVSTHSRFIRIQTIE